MNKTDAQQILDGQKHGTYRYPKHLITEALRCTGDISGDHRLVVATDAQERMERLGLGLRKEFEQERHIGAVRRSRSRTTYLV